MEYNDLVGCAGVALILFAYFLNTCNYIKQEKLFYVMNIFGAGLACYASVLINYRPFIILEGVWLLVSVYGLMRTMRIKMS